MANICLFCGARLDYDEDEAEFVRIFGIPKEIVLSRIADYNKYYKQGLCGHCAYHKFQEEDEEFDEDYYKLLNGEYDEEDEEDLA